MAVEVGVTHKPDVTMHAFEPEDQYMIMASDGVWELISSQVGDLMWLSLKHVSPWSFSQSLAYDYVQVQALLVCMVAHDGNAAVL